jgi:membrane fusion protein (multidrug efflux system)
MADADPGILRAEAAVSETRKPARRLRKFALMAAVPLLLLSGAVWYCVANNHYVSTDNAYVRQDKVSISAELSGRIIDVGVKENEPVKAGQLLFRIDPEPYRIAMAQADATIAAAQVKVIGAETEYQTTGVDIAARPS